MSGNPLAAVVRTLCKNPWLVATMLVAATFVVYMQCWQGDWLWDDGSLLLSNPVLKPGGLAKVWSPPGYMNYWPLTYTVYWIEFHLWDLHPLGYHLVNIGFHALAALLVWRVLRSLQVPGALFAAAIFALHPVNVESVAWVAQLKGILALVLALISVVFYLSYEQNGGGWRYALAILVFFLAALAKGDVITLPIVLLALAWWQRGRIQRNDILRVLPYILIAAMMAGVEVWTQHLMNSTTVRTDGNLSRVAIAGRAVWFYLHELIWPQNLIPVYPRWTIPVEGVLAYLPGVMLLAVLSVAWWYRRTWGRSVAMLILCYVALLLPVLGFVNITFMEYSLVADHWQYIAMIVPSAAFAGMTTTLARRYGYQWASGAAGVALLLMLSWLSWRQGRIYRDEESFYGATIAKNPGCWVAEDNLGVYLANRGEVALAIDHYQAALKLKPDFAEAETNLGAALTSQGQFDQGIRHLERATQLDPNYAAAQSNLGTLLAVHGDFDPAIGHLERALELNPDIPGANYDLALAYTHRGQFDLAIIHVKNELAIEPGFESARQLLATVQVGRNRVLDAVHETLEQAKQRPNDTNLLDGAAWVLATNPNASIRDGAQSVRMAELAWKITGGDEPRALGTLAAAYAEVGRFHEAIVAAEKGRRLAQAEGKYQMAAQIDGCLAQYRNGLPYREIRH